MKIRLWRVYFAISFFVTVSPTSNVRAEEPLPVPRAVLENARRTNPNLAVEWDWNTGLPLSISGINPQTRGGGVPAQDATMPTDDEIRKVVWAWFGSRQLGAAVNPNVAASVDVTKVDPDPNLDQQYIVLVSQRLNGIPVFGATAKIIVKNSGGLLGVTDVSSSKLSALDIDQREPVITSSSAITIAKVALEAQINKIPEEKVRDEFLKEAFDVAPRSQLSYFDPKISLGSSADQNSNRTSLTWQVELGSFVYFVDALDASVKHFYRKKHTAQVRMIVDLKGALSPPGVVLIDEAKGISTKLQLEAKDLFDNAEATYKYFLTKHNRDSFNDTKGGNGGAKIETYINYGTMDNAFWCDTGSQCPKADAMFFGPGWARPLDVMAHEFTHGVLIHENGPEYMDEPGAVNESFADIFGSLVENSRPIGGNWIIGEMLPGHTFKLPLRDMANPNMGRFDKTKPFSSVSNNGQPDTFSDKVKRIDPMCKNLAWEDSGCVHLNSGIINKLTELLVNGGSHHGVTVASIGQDRVALLAYRVVKVYLVLSTQLHDAAAAFRQACRKLQEEPANDFSNEHCQAVDAATEAVGLAARTS